MTETYKKVLASTLIIVLVSMISGAVTFTYFRDVETSVGNIFTAGTFDIEISGQSLPFHAWNVLPGWSYYELHLSLIHI